MTQRQRRAALAAACLGWLFSAVDIVLLILFQAPVAEALGVEAQAVRIAIGVGLLGGAVGGVAFAQLGDRHGRVRALGWAVIVYSLATGGMALSPGVGTLMAFRFVAGVGTGGEWALGFALIAEVWPSASRGRVGGLVTAMFNVGTFLAIALYQSGLAWRSAFALMIAPAAGVLWLRSRVPESPVWEELQAARRAGTLGETLSAELTRAPVGALLRTPWRAVTLRTTLLFAVLSFAFYGFSTVFINYLQHPATQGGLGLDRRGEAPYQLALNIAAMIGVILAGTLSDRLGRRPVFTAFCALGVAGYAWLHALTTAHGGGPPSPLLLWAFVTICAGYGVNGVLGAMAPELFPTHLRATGPGFAQNIGKGVGGMTGPPLAGYLVGQWGFPLVLAAPGALMALCAGLVWLLPKVGGREVRGVEDAAFLTEGDSRQFLDPPPSG